jgi:phosphocarrier protein HPr
MEIKKLRILSLHGLHLREAARIITIAKKFSSKIQLWHKTEKADMRSILDVLTLAVPQHSEVTLVVEGPDEKEAMREITQTFQDGGGI